MIDLRRCPRTARLLEAHGVVLEEGKPELTEQWWAASVPHLRGKKKEHKARQEAVRLLGDDPSATAFLGWVLLTDSWRHVRAEAVTALVQHQSEAARALLALALADRSNLVVRAGQEAVQKHGGLPAFLVLAALWEDRGAELDLVLEALIVLARRLPQPGMRQVLPRLEQEARRFFILPAKRRRLREVIALLDQATAHLKDLPLMATAGVEATSLPLPASCSASGEQKASGRARGWLQRLLRR
jgi:HEAT repeats